MFIFTCCKFNKHLLWNLNILFDTIKVAICMKTCAVTSAKKILFRLYDINIIE